ncbi:hypothetical protein C8R46DRAFT_1023786 [Mycena filopes]|nr:hypothetical protein C8R46DRAFT_1023786 [Mycena filopes]
MASDNADWDSDDAHQQPTVEPIDEDNLEEWAAQFRVPQSPRRHYRDAPRLRSPSRPPTPTWIFGTSTPHFKLSLQFPRLSGTPLCSHLRIQFISHYACALFADFTSDSSNSVDRAKMASASS